MVLHPPVGSPAYTRHSGVEVIDAPSPTRRVTDRLDNHRTDGSTIPTQTGVGPPTSVIPGHPPRGTRAEVVGRRGASRRRSGSTSGSRSSWTPSNPDTPSRNGHTSTPVYPHRQ